MYYRAGLYKVFPSSSIYKRLPLLSLKSILVYCGTKNPHYLLVAVSSHILSNPIQL
nr:MAG TPA: hypothetical protein [Bacteriophage sp.]